MTQSNPIIDRIKRRLLELAKHHNSHQKEVPLDTTKIIGYFRDSSHGPIENNNDIIEAINQLINESLFIEGKDMSLFLTDLGYKYIEENL